MARMIGHAEHQLNDRSDPAAGPELPPEAVRFGAALEQARQLGELCGGEAGDGAPRGRPLGLVSPTG